MRAPETGTMDWHPGYRALWLDSGTTAMAVAVRTALAVTGRSRALFPAYTCPDVCSAALWAGARPALVDTETDAPWLAQAALLRCLDETVAAVIAPHFLGLAHPLAAAGSACQASGAVLIEDSAQLGPGSSAFRPSADLVVLSFGRGKPVPVGGGALLYREHMSGAVERVATTLPVATWSAVRWRGRALLQNLAMTRWGYGLASRLPGLRVGETRFRKLESPRRLRGSAINLADEIVSRWSPPALGIQRELQRLVQRSSLVDVAGTLAWDGTSSLLRYPVLASSPTKRDSLVSRLRSAGLGATEFYGSALPATDGFPDVLAPCGTDNAGQFGQRLLTLPCHSGVSRRDLNLIAVAIGAGA